MMKELVINKKVYTVDTNEFNVKYHPVYNNLIILNELGLEERIVSLLSELSKLLHGTATTLGCYGVEHGGFVILGVSGAYSSIIVDKYEPTLIKNLQMHSITNVTNVGKDKVDVIYNVSGWKFNISKYGSVVISKRMEELESIYQYKYKLFNTEFRVYVPLEVNEKFITHFVGCIEGDTLKYDNLLHLTMIVKNAGDDFEKVLLNNLPYIDRWTILDTGSTDNTKEIIKRVLVGKKMGQLYEEPFINFRDSRNRCLELAGKDCKFTIMLDDTYMIQGQLREFLNTVRGDQFSDSFSIYIKTADNEYVSNRILKTDRQLKYVFRIHEVIQEEDNKNVCIPLKDTWIFDYRCDYMEKRTMDRKKYDLELLFQEIAEDPDNPRHYYYVAQTYNLLNDHEKAYEYFLKRADHKNTGFFQERLDAYFEAGRLANFKLNKPWEECEKLYLKAYELDKTRPESLYFIGIHYYFENNHTKAYEYMKQAYLNGYPEQSQFSLKPTLSYHYLPKFLTELCYYMDDYTTGLNASKLFIENNKPNSDYIEVMKSWYDIFNCLTKMSPLEPPIVPEKPWFIFVADGGFEKWSGQDIETKGVGGSETFVIEVGKYIQRSGYYNVLVFCKCEQESTYQGVKYIPLEHYFSFVRKNKVDVCMIGRYSEYLPVAIKSHVENIYMIAHDLSFTGIVIPIHPKLKQIFCLTEWHVQYFTSMFPNLKNITSEFGYGVDTELFKYEDKHKVGYNFIYSSYPNRGLLILLHMWKRIIEKYPNASLHIYCDVNGEWVNSVSEEMMKQIKIILEEYKKQPNGMNVFNHGWVDKKTLANAWKQADIWLYPCIFMETFCLTALEAAISKTLVVTCPLAGLNNTVGDRGIMIQGRPDTFEWQEKACTTLFSILERKELVQNYVEKNYQSVINRTWKNQAEKLLKILGKEEEQVDSYLEYYTTKHILEVGGENSDIENTKNHYTLVVPIKPFSTNKEVVLGNIMVNLVKLLRQNKQFDLVYIKNQDFIHLILGFELLKTGGTMKIKSKDTVMFLGEVLEKCTITRRTDEYIYIEKK